MSSQKNCNCILSLQLNPLIVFLVALSFIPIYIFSQSGEIKFIHYTADDGLMHNTICAITQDKKGFIWIGTGGGGLSKFDGRKFINYSFDNSRKGTLGGNTVFALLNDSRGSLWIGTLDGGLSRYVPETNSFVVYRHSDTDEQTLDNDYVRSIFEDSQGNLYIGTLAGLNLLDPQTGKVERIKSSISGDMLSIIENDKHQIMLGSNQGLLYLDKKSNELKPYSFSNKSLSSLLRVLFPIFQDSKKNYWLGTNEGLVKISDLEMEEFIHYSYDPMNPNSMLTNTDIRTIQEDPEGNIWIGSDKGLSGFNPETEIFTHYQYDVDNPLSLSDNSIYDIFIDNANNFWIGTGNNGVNFFSTRKPKFELVRHKIGDANSLNNNIITSFAHHENLFYFGTSGGGLNCLDQQTGKFKFYTFKGTDPTSISSDGVQAVYVDGFSNLWIGTVDNGLNLFNPKKESFKRFFEGSRVHSIVDDADPEYLWVANLSGLIKLHKSLGKFVFYKSSSHPDSLYPFPTLVYRTSDNRLWIGNNDRSGLAWFDVENNKFVNFLNDPSNPNSLCNDGVISLCEDMDDHQLWIGTKNGLNRFDYKNNQFKVYTTADGLPSNNISGLLQDNTGDIWISTHYGLSCYNKESGKFKNFSREDGLQGVEFSLNASYKAKDGKLYFGGKKGFNAFYPENIVDDTLVSPIVFTAFYINNQPTSEGGKDSVLMYHFPDNKEIELEYSQHSFSIEFAAINFNSPKSIRYAYKLENFNENWEFSQSLDKAVYTNVPTGEYVFLVKASNTDGVFNGEPIRLIITVLPPFWKSGLAYLLYSLIIIFSLVFFGKYLVNNATRKQKLKLQIMHNQKEKEIARLKIDFFTHIAHEIRTPLTLIIGPLERVISSGSKSPEKLEEYDLMHKNARHLMRLVNQLMNFRKIEENKYQLNHSNINIVEVLREIYTRFTPLARQKEIEFNFVSNSDFFEISLDYELLISAVTNLLTNAFKYTKSSVRLSVIVPVHQDDHFKKTVKISVRDNGMGIPQEQLKVIFDPFFQIKDQKIENQGFSGIGLGLSYTKSIVELHSGTLTVESENGKGSEFFIEIPCNLTGATDGILHGPEVNKGIHEFVSDLVNFSGVEKDLNSKSFFLTSTLPEILIVEDNDDLRQFLLRELQNNYLIHLAENGLRALEILKNREIELIITDVMMPIMDGLEFCKKVKNSFETSHIPVIILSAKATLDSKIEGTELGADAYLEKPFSLEYLTVLIRNLIDNRTLLKAKFIQQPFAQPLEIANSKADEKFLDTINELIQKNISNTDFSIDELAKTLLVSRSGFHKKLKAMSGLTPNDYIKLIRLKMAAELLKEGHFRVNEICDKVGFNSPSYFSKCFQEQFGMLPSDFAKN